MHNKITNQREMTEAEYTPLAVEITISNFDKSLSFYRDGLGFRVERLYKDKDYTFAALFFSLNNALLMIKEDHRVPKPKDPIMQVRFILPSIEALNQYYKKVQASGIKILKPLKKHYYGLYRFSVKDPDGYEMKFGAK